MENGINQQKRRTLDGSRQLQQAAMKEWASGRACKEAISPNDLPELILRAHMPYQSIPCHGEHVLPKHLMVS